MSLKSLRTCLNFSLPALFLLLLQSALAQPNFSRVDQLLEKNKKALGNNLIALVWKDGKIIYQKEIGQDFTAKTQVPIASSSQWLTAALIMTFVDQGKISLDDPVVKYIPDLEKYMKGYITIRECLGQTTGIENSKGGGFGKLLERKKYESLEEEAKAIAAKEIGNNPSKEFFYGINGPNLAARVAEIVGKKSFDRLIMEKIIRPLKMRNTTFTDDNGGAPNPAAGALSSANDYITFMTMLLNKGMFEGKRILSEASIAEMQKNHFPGLPIKYTPKATEGFEYGFGNWIQEKDGNGNGIVFSCPSLVGTWPYIDKCRNYAAIILVKSGQGEQKKDLAIQFKEAVDAEIGECK
jgi:CubicO group peptidase (beta-lactamase class C family)